MDLSSASFWRRRRNASSQAISTSPPSTSESPRAVIVGAKSARLPLDVAVLEDRTLYSATPVTLEKLQVFVDEHATHADIKLNDLFTVDNVGAAQYKVVGTPLSGIGGTVTIDAQQRLMLDFPAGKIGTTMLSVQGTNSGGGSEILPLELIVRKVNHAPKTLGLEQFTVTSGNQTVIDLFGAFQDEEDADNKLTYKLAGNSRPDLFSSISWDLNNGKLILQHATDKAGTSELTITATDRGGLTVGAGMPKNFAVYDQIAGQPGVGSPDTNNMGFEEIALWTHWYFFDLVNGQYDYNNFNKQKFLDELAKIPTSKSYVPIVFNIENDVYVNTEVGRDLFAEVYSLAQQTRPDLSFGLYRYVPERAWYEPVSWARSQRDQSLGLPTWYADNAVKFKQDFDDWLVRNSLYRTDPVAAKYGGVPLADLMDTINVSLYTFYRNFSDEPYWRSVNLDAQSDRISWNGPELINGQAMRLLLTTGGQFNNGLSRWVDYYAVNVTEDSFQIAATKGGAAIDLTSNFTGNLFAGAVGPWPNLYHDPNVIDWNLYAEGNVAEGRKYNKPVYAWISPSMIGGGQVHMEQDFFRLQLEVLKPMVDGIVIYEPLTKTAEYHEHQGWWAAMKDFMASLKEPPASVKVEVGSNVPMPTGKPDFLVTSEDAPFIFGPSTLLANDLSGTGQPLSVVMDSGPLHGRLEELSGGRWRYTPDANFHGTDTWTYRAVDSGRMTDPIKVEMKVNPVNDTPVVQDDIAWVLEDGTLRMAIKNLLANDVDVDGDNLTWQLVSGPTKGNLQLNSDGTFTYKPLANFSGVDKIAYRVFDGTTQSANTATVMINVEGVNDRPVAVADALQVVKGKTLSIPWTNLLANDYDADGDLLTPRWVELPANGTLKQASSGQWSYTPKTGFVGTDQFRYVISDGSVESTAALVTIQVLPVAMVPIVTLPPFQTVEDQSLELRINDLLANASFLNLAMDDEGLKVEVVKGPEYGKLDRTADGNWLYTPARDYYGADSFGYRVIDSADVSELVTLQIQITPKNDAPLAKADVYRVAAGNELNVGAPGVLGNDLDVDGDDLRAQLVSGPRFGSLTLESDGSFAYRPKPGYNGTDSFRYRVIDPSGAESIGLATIHMVGAPSSSVEPLLGAWPPSLADLRAAWGVTMSAGKASLPSTRPSSGSLLQASQVSEMSPWLAVLQQGRV